MPLPISLESLLLGLSLGDGGKQTIPELQQIGLQHLQQKITLERQYKALQAENAETLNRCDVLARQVTTLVNAQSKSPLVVLINQLRRLKAPFSIKDATKMLESAGSPLCSEVKATLQVLLALQLITRSGDTRHPRFTVTK